MKNKITGVFSEADYDRARIIMAETSDTRDMNNPSDAQLRAAQVIIYSGGGSKKEFDVLVKKFEVQ